MTLSTSFLCYFIEILLLFKAATSDWSTTIAPPNSCPGAEQCFESKNFLNEAGILLSENVSATVQVFTTETSFGEDCLSLDTHMCKHSEVRIPQSSPFFYISSLKTFRNSSIQILCLKNQQIACIQLGFFESYPTINGLIMSHNNIKDTHWISALSTAFLIYLDLSHNQISSVEKNVFQNFSHLLW